MTTKVLIIANEVIGRNMAGPAIRIWELTRVLSSQFDVTLAIPPFVPKIDTPDSLPFPAHLALPDEEGLRALAREHEVLFIQGFVLQVYPWLAQIQRKLVLDIYDPYILESLQQYADLPPERRAAQHLSDLSALIQQLRAGDFFVCSSEGQRDFWLGMLTALNRINPASHDVDWSLRNLIDVVPFGLHTSPPEHPRAVMKGVRPGIAAEDRVVLWAGGIWNWLDPLTAIRAMAVVARVFPNTRLFFLGIKHPNPNLPPMRIVYEAQALATELGLLDRVVFFNDWVPYQERGAYLLESDVGLSLHHDHIETRFAFRTRLLDHIWAGLPMVVTQGDTLAQRAQAEGLGFAVPADDPQAVADALLALLSEPDARQARCAAFARLAAEMTWERVAEPLVAFCARPHFAEDRAWRSKFEIGDWRLTDGVASEATQAQVGETPKPIGHIPQSPISNLQSLLAKSLAALGRGGFRELNQEARQYLRWQIQRRRAVKS